MSDISLDLSLKSNELSSIIKELKDLNSSLEKTEKIGKSSAKGLESVDDSAKKSEKSINTLSGSLKSLMANPLVATTAAITGLVAATVKSTEAINTQIKAERNLSNAVSSNSKLTQDSTKNLAGFASELQKSTTFGDEYTMSLLQMGAQAGATEEEIKNMTKLALDISTQSGQDAQQVMKGLSLAYQDVDKATKVLTQSGIALTQQEQDKVNALKSAGKEAEANQIIFDKLSDTFSGASEKEAQSFEGQLKQISNLMGDIGEEFGRVAISFAQPVTMGLKDAVESFYNFITQPEIIESIQNVIAGINVAFSVLKDVVLTVFNFISEKVSFVIDTFNSWKDSVDETGDGFNGLLEIGTNVLTTIVLYVQEIISSFGKLGEVLISLVTGNFEQMKKSASELGESFNNILDPKKMYDQAKEVNKGIVEQFNKAKDDVKKNWEFGGENSKLPNPIPEKEATTSIKNIEEQVEKSAKEMISKASAITSSFGGAISSITGAVFDFKSANEETFSLYNDQLEEINNKYNEYYEIRRSGEEQTDNEAEKQVAYLENEYQKQDALGKQAIQIKLDNIKAEQKRLDDEKKAQQKTAEEEKAIQLKKEQAIANVEYQKALSVHNNELANAKTKHEQTIAEATIGGTMGILQGSLGFAKAIAELGAIAGPIVGAANMATVIATVASGASEVKSSAGALSSLQGQAPKPPEFRFGTMGYNLEDGNSAIVGEAGTEIVTNRGGMLQVDSAFQTDKMESKSGDNIYVTINASQFSIYEMEELVQNIISSGSFKERDFSYGI